MWQYKAHRFSVGFFSAYQTLRRGSRAVILPQSMCPRSALRQPPKFHPGLKPFSHIYFFFLLAFSNLPATILPSQPPPTPCHLQVWAWARSQTRLKWKAVMKASSLAEATVSVQDFETPPCKLKSSQKSSWTKPLPEKDVFGEGVESNGRAM